MAQPDDAAGRSHLDLRELEAFVVVARTRHFGAAAAALRITQSAVSQRISRLEHGLRLVLLVRSNQGVALTDEGSALLTDALRLLAARRAVLETAEAMRRRGPRKLRLLVSNAVLPSAVLHGLRDVVAEDANEDVLIDVVSADSVPGLLLAGGGDLAISTLPPPDARIAETVFGAMPLGVARPGGRGRPVTAAELCAQPLIVVPREHEPEVFDRLVAAAVAAGQRLRIAQTVVSFPSVLAMVALGQGWGVVPVALARSAPAGVRVDPLRVEPPLRIGVRVQWLAGEVPPRVQQLARRIAALPAVDQQR